MWDVICCETFIPPQGWFKYLRIRLPNIGNVKHIRISMREELMAAMPTPCREAHDACARLRYGESTGGRSPSCTVTPQLSHWMISSASSLLSPRHTQQIRMCSIRWALQVWASSSEGSCRRPGGRGGRQRENQWTTLHRAPARNPRFADRTLGAWLWVNPIHNDDGHGSKSISAESSGLSSRDCPWYHPNFHRD